MSQPCFVKPSGWPSVGPPLLFESWQSLFGGTCVNRPGNSATTTSTMRADEIQNIGRLRTSFHASVHRFEGLPSAFTVSMATSGVSSMGATKCSWVRLVMLLGIADPRVENGVQQIHQQVHHEVDQHHDGHEGDDGGSFS